MPPSNHSEENKSNPETKTPQNVVEPSAFYTREMLLVGCPVAVKKLVPALYSQTIEAIRMGTQVKVTNGADWIWARVTSEAGPAQTEFLDRVFDAVILTELPPTSAYNIGSRIRIDARRIFETKDS